LEYAILANSTGKGLFPCGLVSQKFRELVDQTLQQDIDFLILVALEFDSTGSGFDGFHQRVMLFLCQFLSRYRCFHIPSEFGK
jgi:hypothetical protein